MRQQPREMFERMGAENVSDATLLAIILRAGTKGLNVVELAEHLLHEFGSLTALTQASVDELANVSGIGPVKAQVLKASLELARRVAEETTPERPVVRTPEQAAGILRQKARSLDHEVFWVLLLDAKYRMKKSPHEVSKGVLDASLVHPREVFKPAIQASCAAVVLVHNHPSGDPSPSQEDIKITRQLIEAGKIMDITVLDHVILGRVSTTDGIDFCSLRETGLLEF